ncbi:MAG TPA: hypothetical protein VMS93_11175 [Candidatus Saccharimonadales bacterium]|nr:hypothetical protein [Candidatus Saccharimonadales bacterium]
MSAGGAQDPATAARLRRALHAWYRRHHRRLPWRDTRDPYAIWVSEVMLQQTRVATALERYPAFLSRFPDLAALARSPEAQVLAAWSGLGYYRRARALHAAARILVRDHGGRFPAEPAALAALPGIGRSTAGAIASIAFDRPAAVLDGNVARVLQRLMARAAGEPPRATELWAQAQALLPARAGAIHTQAMMELGAVVCLPARPRCPACPVSRWCGARTRGLEQRVPAPAPRARGVSETEHAALAWSARGLVLQRRDGPGPLRGLVGLPLAASRAALLHLLGAGARVAGPLPAVRHAILNRRILTHVWEVRVAAGAALGDGLFAVPRRRVFEQPLDGTSRKVLRARLGAGG